MVARISIVLPKAIHAKVKVHSLVYSSGLDNTFSLHKRRRKVCACAHPQPCLHLLDSPHRARPVGKGQPLPRTKQEQNDRIFTCKSI